MNRTTRTTRHLDLRGLLAVGLVTSLVVACGGGSDDVPTETTVDAGSGGTGDPVPETEAAQIFVHAQHPTCTFRIGELNVRFVGDDPLGSIGDIIGNVIDVGPIAPDGSAGDDIHLLRIGIDPLAAAASLTAAGFDAAPNYIFAFAPGWKYAPFDDATPDEPRHPPASDIVAKIAVLDTGWARVADAAAANVAESSSSEPPGSVGAAGSAEVTEGVAAGHGTFIVNELGQLLPNATIVAAGISPRYTADDGYIPPAGGPVVSIRDDSTVTWALTELVDPTIGFLNMSFGSYGCTALHNSGVAPDDLDDYLTDFRGDGMEPYLMPLGLRTALEAFDGGPSQAFAASGNDAHGPYGTLTSEIFYPAGWAPNYPWLYSVASDPKGDVDYSNRGPWVETQARGSRVVSQLPTTGKWGGEGWYEWSGTSFAAPCALAMYVISPPATKYGYVPSGEYIDCAMNVPPGEP